MTKVQLLDAALFLALLFGAVLASLEAGRRAGKRRIVADPKRGFAGQGAVEGAVFGLMGLLLAFTFSGAASRFDTRRSLIVREANAIGTAYLRIDLLPPAAQPPLRDLFRRYLDSRLTYYRIADYFSQALKTEEDRWTALQGEIWASAVAATGEAGTPSTRMLLVPALNEMIDITTTRAAALRMHPSPVIYAMLGLAVISSALLAGWGMAASRERSILHVACFALIMASAVYVIADLEFPRLGILRVDAFDSILAGVRASMK